MQRILKLLWRNRSSMKLAAGNALVVSAGFVAAKLLAFVYATFLARVAGAETFGEFTLFVTIFILISEVPAAFDVIYIRFANALGNADEADHHLKTCLIVKSSYILLVGGGGWGAAPVVAGLLGKPEGTPLIQYAVAAGAVYSLYLLLIASFQREQRFFWVSALRTLFPAAVLLGVYGLAAFPDANIASGDIAIVYAGIAIFLGVVAATWIIARVRRTARVTLGALLNFHRVGAVLLLAAIIGIVSRRLDVFVLTASLEFSDLGQYGVALRISVLASFISATVSTILVPKAVTAMHDDKMFRRYLALAAFYSLLQTTFALGVIFFMKSLVLILFGENYEQAVPVGIILIIQVLLMSYGIPFKTLIQAGPKPSYMIWTSILRLVTGFMLLNLWIPDFGLQGAAAAVTVTEGLITVALIAATHISRRAVQRPVTVQA